MTIKLTSDEFWEQFQEDEEEDLKWDASDKLDVVKKFDTRIASGWWRTIWLIAVQGGTIAAVRDDGFDFTITDVEATISLPILDDGMSEGSETLQSAAEEITAFTLAVVTIL